jgi:uncharacterized membrane-anchored protein
MTDRLDATLQRAIAAGVLPADAVRPGTQSRPWPVLVLTACGAWLSAIPLLVVFGLVFGNALDEGATPYLLGFFVLGVSLAVLHAKDLPLFLEQLAVPGLLVGGGLLAVALWRDLPRDLAPVVLAGIAFAVACVVRAAWLRVLLGAAMACLMLLAFGPEFWGWFDSGRLAVLWVPIHLLMLAGVAAANLQPRLLRGASVVDAASAGWMAVMLATAAWHSGPTFLFSATTGLGEGSVPLTAVWRDGLWSTLSAALAAAAAGFAARAWPSLRRIALLPAAVVLAVLAFILPLLGGVLAVLAWACVTRRWRLALGAATAAAWVLGSAYYRMDWLLWHKAGVLLAAGAVLGLLAWVLRTNPVAAPAREPAPARRGAWLIAGATLVALLLAAGVIAQKQRVVSQGRTVFVALAPADPRSMMQGDFMRLRFVLPPEVERMDPPAPTSTHTLQVLARVDARGMATVHALHTGRPLDPDEVAIDLVAKDGRWVLVTDAWFFREGDAGVWQRARYGEFSVMPQGPAVLVGLADENLKPLGR